MSELSQAKFEKSSFTYSELISKGFSKTETTTAIKELEENNYIYVKDVYVNGTPAYALL